MKHHLAALLLAATVSQAHAGQGADRTQQQQAIKLRALRIAKAERRAKAAYLWAKLAPWSAKPEIVEHFIAEHERMGIGPEWAASFAYGFANAGLTIGRRFPGKCFSPMDVKWGGSYGKRAGARKPEDLRDWRVNITAHCLEAQYGASRGYHDLALCRYIMYPARPHDWGGGRFRRTWRKMQRELAAGYRAGRLGIARNTGGTP